MATTSSAAHVATTTHKRRSQQRREENEMGERREVPEFGRAEAAVRIMRMKVGTLLEALQERFLPHFKDGCADE
jgi:hypothetical protein